jgi:hypothetical protein
VFRGAQVYPGHHGHGANRWTGYHITPAAALPFPEIRCGLGAALGARYRGGRWFESTAAHKVNALNCVNACPCNAIS